MSEGIDQPFNINVQNAQLLVVPLEDGTFDIYKTENKFCNIFADIGIDTEPVWASSDLVGQELVDEIGYAIEMRQI
ncbi:hypothetical protein N824_08120 [Pedobacter sp. V48]|nr:hypothetical protein N824_08120 [Pedobacter sp. V48]